MWLLKNYAKPGQLIFDSHVGSGSLRIACYKMGFDFVGCEIDKDYFRDQENRYNKFLKKYNAQPEIFDINDIHECIYQPEL